MIDAETQRRALTLFEAFLRHAREAGRPGPAVVAQAPPARAAIADEEGWDGPTVERPPLVVHLPPAGDRRAAASDATNPEVRLPDDPGAPPDVPEQSIIVEDDTLTDPSFARGMFPLNAHVPKAIAPAPEPPRATPPPPAEETTPGAAPSMSLDVLLQEMSVLLKYGHAAQVAQELDRWASGRDEPSSLRVGEFELARVDRERGIQRIAGCVQRMLDRGDARAARGAMATLRRAAGDDPRVRALGLRVGRA